jgi:hypothetical protein
MPGMVLYMTGRAPQAVYRSFETVGVSPLRVEPIMLDSLTIKDITDILYRSRVNSIFSYSKILGLRNNLDIQDLACILYWYTGGLGRAVSDTLQALEEELVIKIPMQNRAEGARVSTVLTHEVMTKLYEDYIEPNHSTLPRWSRMLPTWDQEKNIRTVLKLLRGALDGELVDIYTRIDVGSPNLDVQMDDFLSIMGIPFVLVDQDHIRITVSPWMIAALSSNAPFVSEKFTKSFENAIEELRKVSLELLLSYEKKLLLSP